MRGARFALTIVGVLAALSAGCANPEAWPAGVEGSSGPTPTPSPSSSQAVVRLRAADEGPTATLSLGDATQVGARGSICWTREDGSGFCADTRADVMVPESFIDVPAGTVLRVEGNAEGVQGRLGKVREEFAILLYTVQELDLSGGSDVMQADPGEYTLELIGHWPQGEAPFYFGIRMTDEAEAAPAATELWVDMNSVGGDPGEAELSLGEVQVPGAPGSYLVLERWGRREWRCALRDGPEYRVDITAGKILHIPPRVPSDGPPSSPTLP